MSKRPLTAPRVSMGEAGRAPVAGEGGKPLARYERAVARMLALREALERVELLAIRDDRYGRSAHRYGHSLRNCKAWNKAWDAYIRASRRSRKLYRAYIAACVASLPADRKEAI